MRRINIKRRIELAEKYYAYLIEYFAKEYFCVEKLMVECVRIMNSQLPLWKKRVLLTVIDSIPRVGIGICGKEVLEPIAKVNEPDYWKKRLSETAYRGIHNVNFILEDIAIDVNKDGIINQPISLYSITSKGKITQDVYLSRIIPYTGEVLEFEEIDVVYSTISEKCKGVSKRYFEYEIFDA